MKIQDFLLVVYGLLTGILVFWTGSYNSVDLLGINRYYILLALLIILSVVFFQKRAINPKRLTWGLGGGVMIAHISRIIYDITKIPQSHNLLPFELGMTFAVCIAGILIPGYLVQKLR